ncbi:MAG: hypothetical protein ACRD3B_08735 [Candidatus Sulfotelmatobacter sp.]
MARIEMFRGKQLVLASSVVYLAATYGILFLYADSYFCSAPRGQVRYIVSAKVALAFTLWDVLAGACGMFALRRLNIASRWLATLLTAIIAAVGFGSISFWIYRGYGHFLFEGTVADVSCFFTEGSGMVFPIVVAPALTAASLIRSWLVLKTMQKN